VKYLIRRKEENKSDMEDEGVCNSPKGGNGEEVTAISNVIYGTQQEDVSLQDYDN
jgi:hypothetical protein